MCHSPGQTLHAPERDGEAVGRGRFARRDIPGPGDFTTFDNRIYISQHFYNVRLFWQQKYTVQWFHIIFHNIFDLLFARTNASRPRARWRGCQSGQPRVTFAYLYISQHFTTSALFSQHISRFHNISQHRKHPERPPSPKNSPNSYAGLENPGIPGIHWKDHNCTIWAKPHSYIYIYIYYII